MTKAIVRVRAEAVLMELKKGTRLQDVRGQWWVFAGFRRAQTKSRVGKDAVFSHATKKVYIRAGQFITPSMRLAHYDTVTKWFPQLLSSYPHDSGMRSGLG